MSPIERATPILNSAEDGLKPVVKKEERGADYVLYNHPSLHASSYHFRYRMGDSEDARRMKESGFRCYNGCFDSDGERYLAEVNRVTKQMHGLRPGSACVYFPAESNFSVWLNHKQATRDHTSKLACLLDAVSIFESEDAQ